MLPRVSAFLPLRPFSGLFLSSGSREASAAVSVPLAALSATVRTENNIQRYFGISSVIYSKKDAKSIPANEISKKTSESQDTGKETLKRDLLDSIKSMKVEPSTATVQTTKPLGRKLSVSLKAKLGRLQRAGEDAPKKGNEPLSPELVAAAAAVADSLPFDKQTTKSELLQQLRQHEEESRAQERGRQKISFSNIIHNMKIDRSSSARVNRRTMDHIHFDEESDILLDQKITNDVKQGKTIFIGKRLNIFDVKTFADEAPEPARSPSLWEIEFAKRLATVNEQPLKNGFEEMIQWTKEGKLWEFPLNNEAGFDDDGSEFHEHIFLDKHLEGFPKQGPIRHFMELVTCGLSKNPYLSVKQKVEHIEWFRNYFNEKRDLLKESDIQLTQQLEEKCI